MTDQIASLRVNIEKKVDDIQRDIARHQDRLGVLLNVLGLIDDVAAETIDEAAIEPERREKREKRDIRGAVLGTLMPHQRLSAPELASRVSANIGPVTESALARTLVTLVRDGKVQEFGGAFVSLPLAPPSVVHEPYPASEAAK